MNGSDIGKRFGKLVVIGEAQPVPRKDRPGWFRRALKCRCDCGNEVVVLRDSLISGKGARSCGCTNGKGRPARRKTHGLTETRLYRIWRHMKERCDNPNSNRYYCYGARGIKVCPEWHDSFETFAELANKNGYEEELTIERIDNDRGYCPENCKWIPLAEQAKNKSQQPKEVVFG